MQQWAHSTHCPALHLLVDVTRGGGPRRVLVPSQVRELLDRRDAHSVQPATEEIQRAQVFLARAREREGDGEVLCDLMQS